jgi:hypothetical protein
VLTPALFAKKFREFWKRDHTAGHFEVDTSEAKNGMLRLELEHPGPNKIRYHLHWS